MTYNIEHGKSKLVTFIDACGITGAVADIMKSGDSIGDRCEVYIRISLSADHFGKLASKFRFNGVKVCGQPLNAEWGEQLRPGFRTKRGIASGSTWEEALDGAKGQIMDEFRRLKRSMSQQEGFSRPGSTVMVDTDRIFALRVNLEDEFARPLIENNLLPLKQAWSSDCYARLNSDIRSKHRSMLDVDIQNLRYNAFGYPGCMTPGAGSAVIIASMIRAGMPIVVGMCNPRPLPYYSIRYALEKSEIELNFEEIRRRIAPNAVSRLNCLFVSDSTEDTEGIFDTKAPTLKVRIAKGSRVTRANICWFNNACAQKDIQSRSECIENYWMGHSYPEGTDRWEYLVDGIIEVIEGLDDLRDAIEELEI